MVNIIRLKLMLGGKNFIGKKNIHCTNKIGFSFCVNFFPDFGCKFSPPAQFILL